VADVCVQERDGQNVLRLTGPVGAALIDELTKHLRLCTRPGAPDLVVDFDNVTMLSSTTISALRTSLRRAAESGVQASVRCQPGTAAQQVLSLAAVPTVKQDEPLGT